MVNVQLKTDYNKLCRVKVLTKEKGQVGHKLLINT